MIITKYIVTPDSMNEFRLLSEHVDEVKKSNLIAALDFSSNKQPLVYTTKILASTLPDFERELKDIRYSDIPIVIDIDVIENDAIEGFVENSINVEDIVVQEVVSMDYGNSSVTLMLPITPQEKIIQKGNRGNYPLDGGNTISNSMNIIFPVRPNLED